MITQGARVPIYAEYERLLEAGTKPTLAKLTLARKIAAIVLRMLSNRTGEAAKIEEIYRPGRSRDKTTAEQLVH